MNRQLPCLLVRQPYASLIAYGRKRWELRSYDTRRRGHILIAASRGKPIETTDETLNNRESCLAEIQKPAKRKRGQEAA
jgi:hypothetical protein